MNPKLLALYGLKFDPFSPEVPTEALYRSPKIESFCWRIEQAHLREGGFALIHGDPGSGKSVVMRVLAERLARLADLSVGVVHHPQSNLSDFYRELGDIFGVSIRVSNRWGGFKALRTRWLDHLGSTTRRSVLLCDEAQEMSPLVLNELRLLSSARFDSQSLLCIVLAGDARLQEKLRREELIPLGSRIRTRLAAEAATRDELLACLEHLLTAAGNASLMTRELRQTLVDHAAGNYRILVSMAAELLMSAAQREITTLDEKLYLQVYGKTRNPRLTARCGRPLTRCLVPDPRHDQSPRPPITDRENRSIRYRGRAQRVEQLVGEGGFALLSGAPGLGKSTALRILAERLGALRDVQVGVLARPQASMADFYREMGELFGVELHPHNRHAGAKVLRARWQAHIDAALSRPVLIVDEGQEVLSPILAELRLLSSARLDSHLLLTIVLAGDQRLLERFRSEELLPLGSRMRVRLTLERVAPEELRECLTHALAKAGAPKLMTTEVMAALADHVQGNLRALMNMGGELLAAAAQREARQIDEQLFFDTFTPSTPLAANAAPLKLAGRRR